MNCSNIPLSLPIISSHPVHIASFFGAFDSPSSFLRSKAGRFVRTMQVSRLFVAWCLCHTWSIASGGEHVRFHHCRTRNASGDLTSGCMLTAACTKLVWGCRSCDDGEAVWKEGRAAASSRRSRAFLPRLSDNLRSSTSKLLSYIIPPNCRPRSYVCRSTAIDSSFSTYICFVL